MKPAPPTFPPPPPKLPKVEFVETLVVSIESDDEILLNVPNLASCCKYLLFTSSSQCQSMEKWQILFEKNGFKFVRNTYDPTIRTMLFESLK